MSLHLYADDAATLVSAFNFDTIYLKLQEALVFVNIWCDEWRVELNPQKTEAVLFSDKRQKVKKPLEDLGFPDESIKWKDSVRYLGVILDQHLTFQEHVQNRINLAKAAQHRLALFLGSKSKTIPTLQTKAMDLGQITGAVFFDIAKAFDKVWHEALLYKMCKKHLPGDIIKITQNFLTNRTFKVRVKDELSTARNILAGVPQGSVTGPTLFNIYIDDFPCIEDTSLHLFADDTAILASTYDFDRLHMKLQEACIFSTLWVPLQGYGGAVSVLMLESAAKASASMLGTASNYRQSQTFTKVCLDHGAMINESCTPIPHSMRSDVDLHAASPVTQNKQGRVQDLGRGFCPISIIQSPQTSNFAASKQLSILQCNINGLCSTATKIKLEEIMEIAEKQKIQIIALQETKLNEKYNLKYRNYNILRKDRNKEGGGLAFLIKNLYYEDIAINIPNTSDLEAQGIKVYLNQNKTINIFNMYHPPNNKLIDDGTMAQFLTDNTIIVGDLNAKHQLWGCFTPNPRGKILSNLFDDNAFMCLNDGNPTHHSYSYNTAQALDISFSSPDIFHKCKWQILKSIGSDHLPILIEISTKTKTSSIKEKFWNFKKANWNLYQQNTNEDFRKAPTRIKDLEQNWISFKNTIIKAAKVSIPRGNIKKWIPNYTHQAKDIQTLITKRNELQKKCTQNQTNCRTELNIVNAKIKRLYVNMKREKWKQTCENLNPRNPNTKLWHLAKQIDRAQPQTENTNMIKNTDGTPATNDKNAANLLGNSYQISSKIKFEIKDKKVEKKARKIIHDCKNVTSTHNIFHEKINMKELDYALENTDLNKTPGPDGIHGQMISNLGKNGKEKLLDIFNNSWKTGKLPQDWKTATIIPIKKLDKSADDPKNYRPISLTSICCKLMEKIILRRLTYHLDTRNLLPKEQYGFRKGHGTIDQLLFFTQKVKDAQNRKPTSHTIAAFLDLTQAFDKVWKNKLITKLYKHFKIDGKAITWINDFLKNRYIRVKYNGTLSKTFKLYQGLPQGSVLSPTLFTLFIAGIEEKISHKTNIGLFADDIILWSSNTNWKKAERDLNKTLFHLEKFANKHKLEFNPQKSETCLFTTDKKLYKIRPKIILKEQQLQYNKHPKYLGYTLDPEINSSKHIEEVIRKGRDRLKILKYISGREWGADATTLKLTYTSLIRPILEYGYQIYGTASETNLKSLERIQLSAARIITGLRNTCPNDIVLYEADIMPLKDRRSYNLPKYINKIKSYGNKHRTSKYILNWESNLRLKKEGPLHLAKRNEFLKYKVEKNYLAEKISPCKPLQDVIFNATLNEPTNKQYQNPEYLKQLSLEIINNIPKNAITIYTDGSRDELGHTGSGCLIKTTNGIEKMNRRNPDFCSVFRSELIAIYEALKSIRNTNYQDIWILTDSRSAIQHLSHTGELRDKVSRNIIGYLQKLSKTSKIHLQWIPSHVGIEGNEAADVLAKKGTKEPLPQKNKLTFKEIETIAKTKINKNWRIPPKHSWYSGVNPGGALKIRNRQHQTTLTRFRTGHLKPLKIENNNKIYPTCPKCSLVPAAPEHILACIRCTKQDLWERPLLIIKQLEEHELMEFILDDEKSLRVVVRGIDRCITIPEIQEYLEKDLRCPNLQDYANQEQRRSSHQSRHQEEKPLKVVLKGMTTAYKTEDIAIELATMGFTETSVKRLHRQSTKRPMNIVLKVKTTSPKCANCEEAHIANYRGCPKFPRVHQQQPRYPGQYKPNNPIPISKRSETLSKIVEQQNQSNAEVVTRKTSRSETKVLCEKLMQMEKTLLQISEIYKKPDAPLLEEDLNELIKFNHAIIVAGDWNSKQPLWGSRTSNNSGIVLHNFSERESLDIVAPSSPTHYSPLGTPDFLDFTVFKNIPWTPKAGTTDDLSSDHLPVILELNCPKDEFTTQLSRNEIGVSSDIEKAFLQIGIREEDRDYQRFLWYDKEGKVMLLCHARVVFEITSPYLLFATLSHHLNKAPEPWQETAELLMESLYINNCVASFSEVTDMEKFVDEEHRLLASAHFNLHDWTSNVNSTMCDGPRS
ncbi:hypothetical protein LAZ67_6003711 [Cordylochernes scorpioides]|uniref:RNA-directed DNA polymerase from mobile element jockey n=1 Tax=Cordylochernes scorpioides TaxID=51811 RepID=A0ABY6KM86_9ARAC|nr:hypothetical protein LAZ67_6003711 [Cordylochernes scorpioides]